MERFWNGFKSVFVTITKEWERIINLFDPYKFGEVTACVLIIMALAIVIGIIMAYTDY
jgi:hypothetical protein